MAEATYLVRFHGHPDDVTLWLEEQFQRLGSPDLQVWILAAKRCDWQLAERLVEHGCEHNVAYEILT